VYKLEKKMNDGLTHEAILKKELFPIRITTLSPPGFLEEKKEVEWEIFI